MRRQQISARVLVLAAILLCTLTSVPTLFGQAMDGNLVGTVTDPAGAVVPGATVEITNSATGVKSTTTTSESGFFRFNNLLPGTYELKVSRQGFAVADLKNVTVSLNATSTANVSLRVGDVTQTVEVTETGALIDTTTAQLGATFQKREAIDTPSSGLPLGVLNLSLLGAGVSTSGGLGLGDGPAVGGQRPRNNSFNVEGVDNNRKDVTGHQADIPNEAVAEFSMLLNQYSAEFGNGTGGQFNTVIRSGGNEIHGSVFEYLQNRNLNAVDESFKRQGILENPRYDQSTLGASVGGPIVKNRLFYYGLYQYNPLGHAATQGSPILAPTAAGYDTLGRIPGISQTNYNILKQYLPAAPVASDSTTVSGVRIPIGVVPITLPTFTNIHTFLASGDYTVTDKDQLRVRFVSGDTSGYSDSTLPALPAFQLGRPTTTKLFTLGEFHNFSPTVLNEFRFGYNRYNDNIPSGDFKFPGLDVFPNIQIDQDLNAQLGPYTVSPQSTIINTYQLIDNVSWNLGKHNLKFGWEGRKYIAPQTFTQRVRGDYNYSTLERYILDLNPDELAERNTGGAPYEGNQFNTSWFVNDQFQVRRNLSLSLGVRYEYKGIPKGDKLQTLNAISTVPGLLEFREPRAQKNGFVPRIGLAYSPGASGKTSIRAGFGMAQDKYFDNLGLLSTPPQLSATVDVDANPITKDFLKNGGIKPTTQAGPVCVTAADCRSITSAYIADQKLPYSIQWNLGVQHVFRNDYTLEVRYLGTRGVHLFTQNRINAISKVTPSAFLPTYLTVPSSATLAALPLTLGNLNALSRIKAEFRPYFPANIVAFDNRGNSIYHGLATELTRRYARNLLFKLAYTWSHNIDDSTADLFSTLLAPRRPEDFQDMRRERSNSFIDRRHRFTYNAIYDLPWFLNSGNAFQRYVLGGFILSGTYTYESPQFGTVQSGVDSNLNGDSAGDRTIINLNGVPNTGSSVYAVDRSGNRVATGNAATVAYVAVNPNAQYIQAQAGALTNGGRQTMSLRPINNWDAQLKKAIRFGEQRRLELAGQFYNLFNHAQYIPGYINNVQFHNSNTTRNNLIPGNAQFNRPDLVYNSNSRTIQVTARFQF
jgi:hypothetical protein